VAESTTLHDLFLFKDDMFRYETEIIRNEPCAGMGQNCVKQKLELDRAVVSLG
jgi:hypothetical protein